MANCRYCKEEFSSIRHMLMHEYSCPRNPDNRYKAQQEELEGLKKIDEDEGKSRPGREVKI
jgi:hypothetical protein